MEHYVVNGIYNWHIPSIRIAIGPNTSWGRIKDTGECLDQVNRNYDHYYFNTSGILLFQYKHQVIRINSKLVQQTKPVGN